MRRSGIAAALILAGMLALGLAGAARFFTTAPGPSGDPSRGPAPAPKLGVFLVVVDTLRADRLSCQGFTPGWTPGMDALAARGARFPQAYSAASWTVPGTASILTSRLPTQLGLVERPPRPDQRFAWREKRPQREVTLLPGALTLAEMLSEAGFTSAAFVNQPGLSYKGGFMQGFSAWFQPRGADAVVSLPPDEVPAHQKWGPNLDHAYALDGLLVERFGHWLGETSDPQVFAWLHLLTPHNPYLPPPPFAPPAGEGTPAPAALYDGEVRAVDALVGRILEIVDARGIDRVVLALTADHGEAFGEHGMSEHGHSLHAEVTRVPMLIAGAGIPPGAVVAGPVSTLDLAPTILALAGVTPPPGLLGRSLLPAAAGAPLVEAAVPGEAMLYGPTERALRRGDHRILSDDDGARWALYDVAADPGETRDLAADAPALAAALRGELTALHARAQADQAALGASGGAQEDPGFHDALKALGYVDE